MPKETEQANRANLIDGFMGATLRGVIGAAMGLIVYNPVSSLYAAMSRLARDFGWRPRFLLKTAKAIILLLVAPVFGPLKGILYDGFYLQGAQGWQQGFLSALVPIKEIPKGADLTKMPEDSDKYTTPISARNIFFGLIILCLTVAAGFAVMLPLAGIASFAASIGLSSVVILIWKSAFIVAGAVFIAGTLLYGFGVGMFEIIRFKNGQEGALEKGPSEDLKNFQPSVFSKIVGAIAGALYGALTALVICNPISSFYSTFRICWRATLFGDTESFLMDTNDLFWRLIIYPFFLICSPLCIPLYGIFYQGLWQQCLNGWKNGFTAILGFDPDQRKKSAREEVVSDVMVDEGNKDYSSLQVLKERDVFWGLLITALVVATGLAFLIPPVSVFLSIPALLTTIGLAGLGILSLAPWSSALIGAGASLVALTVSYGIASNLYDVIVKQPKPPGGGILTAAPTNSSPVAGREILIPPAARSPSKTEALHADQYCAPVDWTARKEERPLLGPGMTGVPANSYGGGNGE